MGHFGTPFPVSLCRVGVRSCRSGMGHSGSGHDADGLSLKKVKWIIIHNFLLHISYP